MNLLHTVSQYVYRTGRGNYSPCNLKVLPYCRDVLDRSIAILDYKDAYFQSGSTTHVHTKSALDVTPAVDPNITLIGPYFQSYTNSKSVKALQTVYAPPPFVNIVLEGDIYPVQMWACLLGAVTSSGIQS